MRRKVTERANGILQTAAEEAAAKLIKLSRDGTPKDNVQLAATIQILDRSASSELEERVNALEDSRVLQTDEPAERLHAV
jgi:hypothetical protein